jgi:hypothetical protein
MILCFPDLDTLRLVVTTGILPSNMTLSAAHALCSEGGSIFIDTPHKLSKKTSGELTKLNVTTAKAMPGEPEPISCWLQVVPVEKESGTPQLSTQAPVLFELPTEKELPAIVGEMLRLGNDRQGYRWLQGIHNENDRRVLLRVIGPPYYTLLRAIDHLTVGDQTPVRAYLERAPRVWVEVGFTHPFASQIKLADEQMLLIRSPKHWEFLPEVPFRDVYQLIQFQLPHEPVEWQAADDATKLTVPLRLVAGNASDAPELWVLRENAVEQLDEFVREADHRIIRQLRFAVVDSPQHERIVVLKVGQTRGTPPSVQFARAIGYKPHSSLPNLFLPVGTRLHPQLRRDAVRTLLAEDLDSIIWLHATGDGQFVPESVPDAVFHSLEDWVDYIIETSHAPLTAWVESTRFDFDHFICGEDKQPKPKDPGKGPKDRPKSEHPDEPLSTPKGPRKGGSKKSDSDGATSEFVQLTEVKKASEWIARRAELQAEFLAIPGGLDHPDRQQLWPKLAIANTGAGDIAEAALCWSNALWEQEPGDPVISTGWAKSEFPATHGTISSEEFDRRLRQSDPPRADVRQFAAALYVLASSNPPPVWLFAKLVEAQKYIELNEPKLPIRAAWLVASQLAHLSDADVLGLARIRDRILQRLLEGGLNPEVDLPFFLRTAGLNDSERVRHIRDSTTELHKVIRKWAELGSKLGSVPLQPTDGNPTTLYIDLMFAFALARLGEIQAATALVDASKVAVEKYLAESKQGIAARFLFQAFRYRVVQAIDGKPLSGRLPQVLLDELEEINRRSQGTANNPYGEAYYAITRMLEQCRIVEPYERLNPYKKYTVEFEGGLKKTLHELSQERDSQRLATRIRGLYVSEERKPDPKSRTHSPVVSDTQFQILIECLPLSARCGGSFAAELLRLVPEALRQSYPQMSDLSKKQGLLLERSLFLAGHFDHRDLITALVDAFAEVVASKPEDQRFELINEVAGSCLKSLRKLGLRDEIDTLLQRLQSSILGHGTFANLKARYTSKPEQWLKALQTMLAISSGWLNFGLTEQATPILEEARTELLAAPSDNRLAMENARLACAYVTTLAQGPSDVALQRIGELFRKMDPNKVTNSFTTAAIYSRLHLNVVEAVVLGLVSDDFAIGSAGRRWLEEDEYLVRRRIHRDMRTLLTGSGL